jgi:hypothetical protein
MSRVFPAGKELNLTNLLSFVVANLGLENRLQLALFNCDNSCRNKVRYITVCHPWWAVFLRIGT